MLEVEEMANCFYKYKIGGRGSGASKIILLHAEGEGTQRIIFINNIIQTGNLLKNF